MSSSEMRVAVAQLDIALGDKEANLAKVASVLSRTEAELVLFPELFTTGFDFPRLKELAEPLDGETVRRLCELAGERIVAGTLLESSGGRVYNTFLLLSGSGIIAAYRKIHLFGEEKRHFAPGDKPVVANVRGTTFGLATCYDLRFPELFRRLTLLGAEVFLLSAEFPAQRQEHFDILIRARAIENQCFVLACNRVGRDEHNS
ncbi:MAG: carbon-nitrogen family hydrolase, partial [Euryarchaeota archaeon]|nr:carbon-nitrogen family hydrolase [Euryarchaeota archaeon]